jgi:hypothetical protein
MRVLEQEKRIRWQKADHANNLKGTIVAAKMAK